VFKNRDVPWQTTCRAAGVTTIKGLYRVMGVPPMTCSFNVIDRLLVRAFGLMGDEKVGGLRFLTFDFFSVFFYSFLILVISLQFCR
jgi:hypothetical protein